MLKKPALHLQNTDYDSADRLGEDGRTLKRAVEKAGVPARVGVAYRLSHDYRPPSAIARDEAGQMTQIADYLGQVWKQ